MKDFFNSTFRANKAAKICGSCWNAFIRANHLLSQSIAQLGHLKVTICENGKGFTSLYCASNSRYHCKWFRVRGRGRGEHSDDSKIEGRNSFQWSTIPLYRALFRTQYIVQVPLCLTRAVNNCETTEDFFRYMIDLRIVRNIVDYTNKRSPKLQGLKSKCTVALVSYFWWASRRRMMYWFLKYVRKIARILCCLQPLQCQENDLRR